ncbi:hypothetical protein [Aeriscardovia aeriphila]|uniref:Uncharacterized protein n=1 Tax=Aeriscardovia aeriphila TaxID=218139 RepID=A0A261FB04_9BIFI|nr:hypothetical protein [Aeriscardovia aeriphila]NYI25532.1 hypothetical protein [Aeriscardovia aeriphila]OZG56319.1 hypothetical protein AEAE_0807 [Aeriscardovia aeriphila]
MSDVTNDESQQRDVELEAILNDRPKNADMMDRYVAAVLHITRPLLSLFTLAEVIAGAVIGGAPHVWAIVLAVVVVVIFCLSTPVAFWVTSHMPGLKRAQNPMRTFTMATMVNWIFKLVILFGTLLILGDLNFYDHTIFVWSVFVGAVLILGAELVAGLTFDKPSQPQNKKSQNKKSVNKKSHHSGSGLAQDQRHQDEHKA